MLWAYIFINGSSESEWLRSMFYFPHAARVLCVVYFGYKALPGLYLGELVGPYILDPGVYILSHYLYQA